MAPLLALDMSLPPRLQRGLDVISMPLPQFIILPSRPIVEGAPSKVPFVDVASAHHPCNRLVPSDLRPTAHVHGKVDCKVGAVCSY